MCGRFTNRYSWRELKELYDLNTPYLESNFAPRYNNADTGRIWDDITEMAKPRGRCVFCQGFHLSKEHLFSDWLRELFPRDASDTHTIGEADESPWRLAQKQGHSGSKKIRTVCEKCNNEWISTIDDDAKGVASPLIRGDKVTVTPEIQLTLSRWLAKIATVADSRKSKSSVINQAQRKLLMDSKQPPNEWEIWVASYEGSDFRDLGLFQRNGHLDFTPVRGPGEYFKGYVETTFIGMGRLTALVIANDLPLIHFTPGQFPDIAKRIWPRGDAFDWPLPHTMDDSEATSVANIMQVMLAKFR